MPDSQPIDAERGVQPRFSKIAPLAFLLLPLCVLLFAWLLVLTPDRDELGPRAARVTFDPVKLDSAAFAPLRLAGAWAVSSDDPRFGGISALAVQGGELLALSDSGVAIRFPRPAGGEARALISELPDGPANPRFKRHRDTEALVADPFGRGWWVAFEVHHELWLYDAGLERALQRIRLGANRWPVNSGIEALAAVEDGLLAVPENGRSIIRIGGSQALQAPLHGQGARVSDAATLPNGEVLLLERRMTLRGFANALVGLRQDEQRFSAGRRLRLPLGPLDNPEALATEPLPGGAVRLWLMTDDNFQPPFRTLLIALDVPPGFRPGG